MATLSHRERVLTALNHQEPDRIPIDFGSSFVSTIIAPAYENLKRHLGFTHETVIMLKRQKTVIPHEEVLQRFDIDTRPLLLGGYRGGNAREVDSNTFLDAWGVTWKRAEQGHFINADGPFQHTEPNTRLLEEYPWPDPLNPGFFDGLKERAQQLRKTTDCAIVLNLPVGVVHQSQFLRGYSEWLIDLSLNPEFAENLMDRIVNIWIKTCQRALKILGNSIDIILWGDDIALQQSTLMNPEQYRLMVKPRHRKMVAAVKEKSDAKIVYHSCGSVAPLMEDFIEIGIDVINPVQVKAADMDPLQLKKAYGNRISFWGAIDTQGVLPFGSPQDVRTEVRRVIDSMADNGGYVLNSVHNIQAEVPPENIVAMFDEAKTYGVYR